MQIIIYSTTTCPYCLMLKEYLSSKHIQFVEKMVDQNEADREEMSKVSGGFLGVPFIYIKKDDGTVETIIGFDKGKINLTLGVQG